MRDKASPWMVAFLVEGALVAIAFFLALGAIWTSGDIQGHLAGTAGLLGAIGAFSLQLTAIGWSGSRS